MTYFTCRLTAKNRDQLRNPTLGSRVWATFTFLQPAIVVSEAYERLAKLSVFLDAARRDERRSHDRHHCQFLRLFRRLQSHPSGPTCKQVHTVKTTGCHMAGL